MFLKLSLRLLPINVSSIFIYLFLIFRDLFLWLMCVCVHVCTDTERGQKRAFPDAAVKLPVRAEPQAFSVLGYLSSAIALSRHTARLLPVCLMRVCGGIHKR